MAAVVFLAAPSGLVSQNSSLSQQLQPNILQPFARFDDSLARVADSLLVSATAITPPATVPANAGTSDNIDSSVHHDQRFGNPYEPGQSAAATRLSFLRPVVEPILRNHGVPTDLVSVILVESGGRTTALSPKGARGLWQLMPDTARRYGLRVDEIQDDRLDLFRSTDAAARYLHDLYAQFGDWKLALAAYNTGEANVDSAILKAHTQDFDQLANLRMLPLETRNYVPRVLATAQFLGGALTRAKTPGLIAATTVFAVSNR